MPRFTIEATKRIYLTTSIEADNYEEALALADELITDDFEQTGTDFTTTFIGEDNNA